MTQRIVFTVVVLSIVLSNLSFGQVALSTAKVREVLKQNNVEDKGVFLRAGIDDVGFNTYNFFSCFEHSWKLKGFEVKTKDRYVTVTAQDVVFPATTADAVFKLTSNEGYYLLTEASLAGQSVTKFKDKYVLIVSLFKCKS